MKVALFGGSFDPIHIGHIKIIEKINRLNVDKIFILPAYLNPFKQKSFASADKRLEWIRECVRDMNNVEICTFEIEEQKPTPTIYSVQYLKNKYDIDKIYLIIGADNLKSLHKWHRYDELKELVEFVVATRGVDTIANDYTVLNIDVDVSSTQIRNLNKEDFIPECIRYDVINHYTKRIQMEQRVKDIINVLDSKKAEDIESFDLKNSDYFVDYVVIATTLNNKHGLALLDYLKTELKPKGESFLNVDEDDNWVVVDLGDILVHLMSENYRAKYNLEEFLKEIKSKMKK